MRFGVSLPLALALLCGGPPAAALQIGEPHVEAIADDGALRDANVSALAEDARGFIWVGTPTGLLRYDGYRFRRYGPEAGHGSRFSGGFVNTMHVGRDGRIWIGTVADGLWVFDPEQERFSSYRHVATDAASLPHDGVYAIAEDTRGGLWVGTVAGLVHFHGGRFERVASAGDATAARIWSLRFDRRGTLWAGTSDGLARVDVERGVLASVASAGRLAGRSVLSLYDDDDGRLWLGTAQAGVLVFDPSDGTLRPAYRDTDGEPAYSAPVLLQADTDTLWIGRYGDAGGIDVVDLRSGTLQHRFRHDPALRASLASDDVRALLRDRAGHIWVGGYGAGLQRIDPLLRGVRMIGHSPYRPDLLSHASVSSVLERSNGELWVGTRGRGIDVLDRRRGRIATYRAEPGTDGGLGSGWIAALAETGDGTLWVGGFGLYRFDPRRSRFEPLTPADGSPLTVRRLLVGSDGTLWIGGNPGAWRLPPGASEPQALRTADGGLLPEDVNAIVQDASGALWFGCDPGLYRLAPGGDRLQRMRIAIDDGSGLSAASIVGLLIDHRGTLWMDSADGLYRLQQHDGGHAAFEAVSARLGIAGHAFGANLLEDRLGRLWTTRYMYDPASDTLYPLTRGDGIEVGTPWFRAHHKTRDGLLLFGSSKGLLAIDPEHFRPWAYEPPVVVSELRIDGVVQPPAMLRDGLHLAAGQRNFAVEVAALDLSAPERNRYAYRLNGYDRDWIETDAAQRVAAYGGLWPGSYRLQVRASNRNGTWSRHELSIPVRVAPAYWQTPWFAGLLLLALTGAALGGHRWRVRRLRRHALALELQVASRTRQLASTNAELRNSHESLSAAHARLLETQQQLVMQEKMASLGQLVAGVAHEINTPLGVAVTAASMLSDTTAELKRRFDSGELRRAELSAYLQLGIDSTRMIDVNLARAAQLVRSFKQVSVDRGSDERRRFNLCDYLRALSDSLEPGCRRQQATLEVDCDPALELDGFPGALGQILTQFTHNALQHAFDGGPGRLRLQARAVDQDRIEIRFADDGSGIEADDLPHIFEPFFTRRRGQGHPGLGLHVAYNLITVRLGGTIDVISEPGAGTCLVLRFPRVAPQ